MVLDSTKLQPSDIDFSSGNINEGEHAEKGENNTLDRVVEEISNDAKSGIHPLENLKYFDYFLSLSREDQLKVADRMDLPSVGEIKEKIGELYVICLAHPGIQARVKEFIGFVSRLRKKKGNVSPGDAVDLFSAHLGDEIYYRGIARTEDEAAQIPSSGLLAPGVRGRDMVSALNSLMDPNSKSAIDSFRDDLQYQNTHGKYPERYPVNFAEEVQSRTGDLSGTVKVCMSVSKHPEVAASVGWQDSRRKGEPGVKPFVVRVRVPKLLAFDQSITHDYSGPQGALIGGKAYDKNNGLEMFIPFAVLPDQIESVQEIDQPKPYVVYFNKSQLHELKRKAKRP